MKKASCTVLAADKQSILPADRLPSQVQFTFVVTYSDGSDHSFRRNPITDSTHPISRVDRIGATRVGLLFQCLARLSPFCLIDGP